MDIRNDKPILSVSEFIEYINIAVGRSVSVEGEISGYNVSQGKWVFFDLKDGNGKVGCFASLWTLHTALEDGMQVVVHGTPRIYPKYGKFSLTVERIELRGDGALRRAFEMTKKKLEEGGLFDVARKRGLPRFPEHIGVIASRDSAAYSDFMRIVRSRWSGCTVTLIHVQVQGERAISDIVRAFEWFNAQGAEQGIEAIALVRGGGSLEDLQAFNSEPVARAIFGSKIPVVCGVGHERDESLADYAADMRAATPTHAASLIVPDREEIRVQVDYAASAISQSIMHLFEWHESRVRTAQYSLDVGVQRHVSATADLLRDMAIIGERMAGRVSSLRETCAFFERTLCQMNPLTVLKRGYTIVKKGGELVTRAHDVRAGDELTVTFSDDTVITRAV